MVNRPNIARVVSDVSFVTVNEERVGEIIYSKQYNRVNYR